MLYRFRKKFWMRCKKWSFYGMASCGKAINIKIKWAGNLAPKGLLGYVAT